VSEELWKGGARVRVRRDVEIGNDYIPVEVEMRVAAPKRGEKQKQYKSWRVERLQADEVKSELREKLKEEKRQSKWSGKSSRQM
jgi:hypothetical protein